MMMWANSVETHRSHTVMLESSKENMDLDVVNG